MSQGFSSVAYMAGSLVFPCGVFLLFQRKVVRKEFVDIMLIVVVVVVLLVVPGGVRACTS